MASMTYFEPHVRDINSGMSEAALHEVETPKTLRCDLMFPVFLGITVRQLAVEVVTTGGLIAPHKCAASVAH